VIGRPVAGRPAANALPPKRTRRWPDIDGLGQLQAAAGDLDIVVVAILERQASGEIAQERNSK